MNNMSATPRCYLGENRQLTSEMVVIITDVCSTKNQNLPLSIKVDIQEVKIYLKPNDCVIVIPELI